MLILRLIPAGIALAALVACAKVVKTRQAVSPLSQLAGSEWGIEGQDEPFVQFGAKGEISGFSGCNRFFGNYEQNGERLIIGPLASTKKACAGPQMEMEREFLSALQRAHKVEATHIKLVVLDEDDEIVLDLIRRDWD